MKSKETSRKASPAQELANYLDGKDRPRLRDLVPATFATLFESIEDARQALLAPFPDLAETPQDDAAARRIIKSCVAWARRAARAFNADPFCPPPYGLQTHFQMQPGVRWARDFLGPLPASMAVELDVEVCAQYLNRRGRADDVVKKWRKEPRAYWSSISRELYWQYRSDRAACRRLLDWVTRALNEFTDEELPRITYVKPLRNRMHQVRITLCGAVQLIELQDNLVYFLAKLAKGQPIEVEHRSVKKNLIKAIPALANCVSPASGDRPATGAVYQLARELIDRIDMKNYAAATS